MIKKLNHYAIPCGCSQTTPPQTCNVDTSGLIPKNWETRYDALTLGDGDILRDDVTGDYTPQGATTDGTFLYRALVKEDDLPTMIEKIELSTGTLMSRTTTRSFGHANDMTFANGKLYIAHSSSTSIIYEVDPNTFELLRTFNVPLTVWGIAYDPVNNLFVLGGVGSGYLSVYYPDFSFMYRIKPQNAFYGLVRQGIHADENYIYIALDNAYGATKDDTSGSRIMVYTWNGIFVKSLHVPIKEIEWAFPIGNTMYIGTYEGRDENNVKSGKIYKTPYDLYPAQTVITGRPTDVSGGLNNLQRLPEGTPVRLWVGDQATGEIVLRSKDHGITLSEDSPFRYLRFRYTGANQGVFDYYPINNGVAAIRETDITAAAEDSNLRVREARLVFKPATQSFTIDSNFADEIKYDKSEDKITFTKYTDDTVIEMIHITQIWGVV